MMIGNLGGAAVAALLAITLGLGATSAKAVDDLAFEFDVSDAIDDGLDYLRNHGVFASPISTVRQTRALLLLALLGKHSSIDPGGAILESAFNGSAFICLCHFCTVCHPCNLMICRLLSDHPDCSAHFDEFSKHQFRDIDFIGRIERIERLNVDDQVKPFRFGHCLCGVRQIIVKRCKQLGRLLLNNTVGSECLLHEFLKVL